MSRLRRDEDGFSLMELLAAMAISSVVLAALLTVFVNGVQGAAKVSDRVEAQQRGRLALDRMTTLLSSQVCLNGATPPIVAGSTASSVTFYGDLNPLNPAGDTPTKYRLTWDSAARTLTETRWTGSGTLPGTITYPTTPTATSQLTQNVVQATDALGNALPIFSYYRFQADGTINLASPIAVSAGGLPLTDADDVVQVGVTFTVTPSRTNTADRRSTSISGQALAGGADPSSPAAGPNCV